MRLNLFGDPFLLNFHPETDWYQRGYDPDERGFVQYPQQLIAVQRDYLEPSTVLHELLHVASDFCGACMTEDQIEAMERGLWTIFRHNPQLLQYWYDSATIGTTREAKEAG